MPKVNYTRYIVNCRPSVGVEKDWGYATAVAAAIIVSQPALPVSIDLRSGNDWWKIGDQGYTGACVGWATADSVLRWHFVKKGLLDKSKSLSPRYIWMAAKETDAINDRPTTFIELEGTTLKAALDIARKYGSVTDDLVPFGSAKLYSNDANTFYAIAAQMKINSYFNLGQNPSQWRQWLANNGPILTRLDVEATWDNATATHGNLDTYQSNTVRGGHAVALVGYTQDRFIVRNSWGTGWGDSGYGYASFPYATAAFTECYGVSI